MVRCLGVARRVKEIWFASGNYFNLVSAVSYSVPVSPAENKTISSSCCTWSLPYGGIGFKDVFSQQRADPDAGFCPAARVSRHQHRTAISCGSLSDACTRPRAKWKLEKRRMATPSLMTQGPEDSEETSEHHRRETEHQRRKGDSEQADPQSGKGREA